VALQSTTIYQAVDLFIAHCYFDAAGDTSGNIAHGIPGLGASALAAAAGEPLEAYITPIIGAGAPAAAALFYAGQYFIVSINATNVVVGKTAGAGNGAANLARVVVRRLSHHRR